MRVNTIPAHALWPAAPLSVCDSPHPATAPTIALAVANSARCSHVFHPRTIRTKAVAKPPKNATASITSYFGFPSAQHVASAAVETAPTTSKVLLAAPATAVPGPTVLANCWIPIQGSVYEKALTTVY